MIVRAVRAEWIKLSTVRATRWTLIASIALGLGIVILTAFITRNSDTSENSVVLALAPFTGLPGIPGIAVIFSAVIGVLSVTSEIRFNTIRTTFLAISDRPVALAAKTAVGAAVCAVAFLAAEFLATVLFLVIGGGGSAYSPFGDGAITYVTLPIAAALASTLGLAVGAAVRNAAGALTLLLAYMMVVESVIAAVPQTRDAAPYLPMANFDNLLGVAADAPWPSWGSLIYLLVVIGALWAGAVTLLSRRDA